jgi:MYXO-CTERM domain-containing protein
LKLFEDVDGNGSLSSSDTLIESLDLFDVPTKAVFSKLDALTYPDKGDEKQLIVAVSASISSDQFIQLRITEASLQSGSKSGSNIVGLPLVTNKYTTAGSSSSGGDTSTSGEEGEDGCATLSVPSDPAFPWALMVLAGLFSVLLARRRQ